MQKKRLVIGISGASGATLGIELLHVLHEMPEWETHLVLSGGACRTIQLETGNTVTEVEALADYVHPQEDIGAGIASGTFKTEGMIVVPCSMKTLAGIANGFSENLMLRAADVTLKERRTLVLVPRETPLNKIHLRNMQYCADAGAILLPPVVSWYNGSKTIQDLTRHLVGKMLAFFDIDLPGYRRWGENSEE